MPKEEKKEISIKCRACPQEIVFLLTKKGNKMPVDVDSLTEEDVAALEAREDVEFRYNEHVSHFKTCPAAKQFSSRTKE